MVTPNIIRVFFMLELDVSSNVKLNPAVKLVLVSTVSLVLVACGGTKANTGDGSSTQVVASQASPVAASPTAAESDSEPEQSVPEVPVSDSSGVSALSLIHI